MLLPVLIIMFAVFLFTPRFIGYSVLAAYETLFFFGDNPFSGDPLSPGTRIFAFVLFSLFLYWAIVDYTQRKVTK